jgi:hypothetical protein
VPRGQDWAGRVVEGLCEEEVDRRLFAAQRRTARIGRFRIGRWSNKSCAVRGLKPEQLSPAVRSSRCGDGAVGVELTGQPQVGPEDE